MCHEAEGLLLLAKFDGPAGNAIEDCYIYFWTKVRMHQYFFQAKFHKVTKLSREINCGQLNMLIGSFSVCYSMLVWEVVQQ